MFEPIRYDQMQYRRCGRSGLLLPAISLGGWFSPLAQGLLTDCYLNGIPSDSHAAVNQGYRAIDAQRLTPERLDQIKSLNKVAVRREQTLAQMSLAWILRDERITSVLTGASRPQQIIDNLRCLDNLEFSVEELTEIDEICGRLKS